MFFDAHEMHICGMCTISSTSNWFFSNICYNRGRQPRWRYGERATEKNKMTPNNSKTKQIFNGSNLCYVLGIHFITLLCALFICCYLWACIRSLSLSSICCGLACCRILLFRLFSPFVHIMQQIFHYGAI